MYVYEPGAGFTGEAKLVEPGFEWCELSSSSGSSLSDSQDIDKCSEVKIDQKLQESQVMDIGASNRYGL